MKDPSAFFAELRARKYKLKGVGWGDILPASWWRLLP
jgi:hypothetical protein